MATPKRRRLGLRDVPLMGKLLVPFVTLLTVVGTFGAFVLVRDQVGRAQATLDQELTEASLHVRSTFQQAELSLLEAASLAANVRGMADAMAAGDSDQVRDLLRSVAALKPDLVLIAALDVDGAPLAVLGEDGAEQDPTEVAHVLDSEVAQSAAASAGNTVRGAVVGHETARVLAIAAPVCVLFSPCEGVGGVVIALPIDRLLTTSLDGVRLGDDVLGGVALLDATGTTIASTGLPVASIAASDVTDRLLRRSTTDTTGAGLETVYAPFMLQDEVAGTIGVTLPSDPVFDGVRATGLRLAAVLLAALAGIVAIGAIVSRSILNQMQAVLATNEALGAGRLDARVLDPGRDEVGEIARGLNAMADQLQASHANLERRVDERTAQVAGLLEQRTELYASLSHELRTPVAIILSESDLLLLDGDGPAADSSRAIRQSAGHLLGLVNDILQLATVEASGLTLATETVSVQDLLDDLGPTLSSLVTRAGCTLAIDVPSDDLTVTVDPGRCREILVNLVDNAIKYSESATTVTIRARSLGDRTLIEVADEGRGIAPNVGDAIFEPFQRVPGVAPLEGRFSTGLGLAITRKLVEAHGGTITYESEVGVGTTFRFDVAGVSSSARLATQR